MSNPDGRNSAVVEIAQKAAHAVMREFITLVCASSSCKAVPVVLGMARWTDGKTDAFGLCEKHQTEVKVNCARPFNTRKQGVFFL